jgi:restriction endonuclease Mrr
MRVLPPLHLERPRVGRLLDRLSEAVARVQDKVAIELDLGKLLDRLNDRIARLQGTSAIQLDHDNVHALSWREVQHLVAGAFRRNGYGVRPFAVSGAPVDLVLHKDGESTFVSCRHWRVWEVGERPLAELYGYMTGAGAHRAMILTTGKFTDKAQSFAARHNLSLVLIDGPGIFDLVHGTTLSPPGPATPSS